MSVDQVPISGKRCCLGGLSHQHWCRLWEGFLLVLLVVPFCKDVHTFEKSFLLQV